MRKLLLSLVFVLSCSPAFAALATPVTITSVTGGPTTWTVLTASPHGIAANNPGFCITGSSTAADNKCGAIASVTDTTHYTITDATFAACAATCGLSRPAPLFVIKGSAPNFGVNTFTICMWTFTGTGIPISGGTSACSASLPAAIQAGANAAIAAGTWIERQFSRDYPASDPITTTQNELLALQLVYQNAQAAATAPGGSIGKSCDVTGCN